MEKANDAIICSCGERTPVTFTRATSQPKRQALTVHCGKCRHPWFAVYNWPLAKVELLRPLARATDTQQIWRDVLGTKYPR